MRKKKMSVVEKNEVKVVPQFDSIEEERDYWDAVPDAFLLSTPTDMVLSLPPRRKKKLVTIRLAEEQIEQLKAIALFHDKKYQTLLRDWLNERLRSEMIRIKKQKAL